jgi:hypothetical protein
MSGVLFDLALAGLSGKAKLGSTGLHLPVNLVQYAIAPFAAIVVRLRLPC